MRRRLVIGAVILAAAAVAVPTAFAYFSATKTSPQPISVAAAPTPITITAPAPGLVDESATLTSADASSATAFNDNLQFPVDDGFNNANFNNAFATNRFYQWDYTTPLPPGQPASNASFDFRFKADRVFEVACFYFEVISAGNVIGTHGSQTPGAANSQWCTDQNEKRVTTPLPEVTTTDIANGLRIKVYGYESGRHPIQVDQATVSGATTGGQNFTLYAATGTNQADGSPQTLPEPVALADSAFYTNTTNWNSSFNTNSYLEYSFPSGLVPDSATIESVQFLHRYQAGSGSKICFYIDVRASLGTVPNPPGTNGASCATGTGSWVSDSIPLPMVDTAGKVNGLVLRLIYRTAQGGGTKSREDYAALQVTYH